MAGAFNDHLKVLLLVSGCLCAAYPEHARSQNAVPQPPAAKQVDSNGVNVVGGSFAGNFLPALSTAGITWRPTGFVRQDNLTAIMGDGYTYNDTTVQFTTIGGVEMPMYGQQGSASCAIPTPDTGICTFITGDGTQVIYDRSKKSNMGIVAGAMATKVIKPDGEVLTYTYQPWGPYPWSTGIMLYSQLLTSVSSSLGWMVKFYGVTVTGWQKVYIVNTSVDYCDPASLTDCTLTQSFPWQYMNLSGATFTDAYGYVCAGSYYDSWTGPASHSTALSAAGCPGSPHAELDSNIGYKVKAAMVGSVGTPYRWTYTYPNTSIGEVDDRTTVTDPYGKTKIYIRDPWWADVHRIYSVTDELNRTTTYVYVDKAKPPTRVILPDATYSGTTLTGGYTDYTYDDRNNLTSISVVPRGGGAPLVTTIKYPTSCATLSEHKYCNKPTWIKDAKGKQTDFTYDTTGAHGGVLTETGPADINGVRPQKRYAYTALYPKTKNAAGTLVSSSTPVWRLTSVSTCAVATSANPASCVGTANETVVTYAYANNNLLKSSETTSAGDGSVSVTTSYGYDANGRQIWVNGPRTDVDDISYTTYDLLGRPIFEISPDPDGTGPLKRSVTKHNYNSRGQDYLTQIGYGSTTNGSDFVVTSFTRRSYDSVTTQLIKTEVGMP